MTTITIHYGDGCPPGTNVDAGSNEGHCTKTEAAIRQPRAPPQKRAGVVPMQSAPLPHRAPTTATSQVVDQRQQQPYHKNINSKVGHRAMDQISIEQLTAIVNQSGTDPVLLFGAGASATSGVPMAYDMAMQAARWATAIKRGWDPQDPRIQESDVQNFLRTQTWFSPDISVEDRYQNSMRLLNRPRELRRRFLFHVLHSVSEPSSGYRHLAQIVKDRIVRTLLTANFDDRFEAAFGPGL